MAFSVVHCNSVTIQFLEEISGIFVKSISKGSAADLTGKIKINDRIVQVYWCVVEEVLLLNEIVAGGWCFNCRSIQPPSS